MSRRSGGAQQAESAAAKRGSRVGLKDIAAELGISQSAVSLAINDKPGVSEETKRNVKEAAIRLGWVPTYAAQALGSSKTMTVGFAPMRPRNDFQDESFMLHFMAGAQTSLSRKGYGLLYRPCLSLEEETRIYRDWARGKRVDAVILVDLRTEDPRPALLRELGLPAVLAGGPDPDNIVPSLSIDDSRVMEMVLTHLNLLGHSHIAYLVHCAEGIGPPVDRVHRIRPESGRGDYTAVVGGGGASHGFHFRERNAGCGQHPHDHRNQGASIRGRGAVALLSVQYAGHGEF